MNCQIMGLRVDHRRVNAPNLQKALTANGHDIKMRIGLHQPGEAGHGDDGVILLQGSGGAGTANSLLQELNGISGVKAQLMEL